MSDGYQTPPPGYPPQAPQYPQQYAPQPAVPAPKRRAPVLLIVLALVGALAVCGCIGAVVLFGVLSGDDAEPWKPTADQAHLMREFGPPETFAITWVSDIETAAPEGEDPPVVRLETWDYPLLGSSFSFRDGVYLQRTKISVPKEDLAYAAVRPDSFTVGMSPDDVSKLLKIGHDRKAAVLPETLEGLEVYSWDNQVLCGFLEGKLVSVRTNAVVATSTGGGS